MTSCCALGPCDRSRQRGGPGCYLCDVVAELAPGQKPTEAQRREFAREPEAEPAPEPALEDW